MRSSFLLYLSLILIACGLYSCSATKYIPEGEYLLDKVYIESDHPELKTLELKPYVRQLPNFKMFAINKTLLQVYNLSGKDSGRWVNRFLKQVGEPPVIFDSTLVDKTQSELRKLFINKGYMNVEVNTEIIRHDQKADVYYNIRCNKPYTISEYATRIEDSAIDSILNRTSDTYIKEGMIFDRDVLGSERDRITSYLRNRGYYAFENDYIVYDADTTLGDNQVNLLLKLHPYPEILPSGNFVEVPHQKYYFDKTHIYLDYDPLKMISADDFQASDSIEYNGNTIYYTGNKPSLKPRTLLTNNFLTPGREYSQSREEITYSAYASLNALNNVSIYYDPFFRNDSALLNTYILTMPAKKQSFTFSVEGTNTAGDLGVASSVNYSHRNLFRGSETFNFKIRGAYEAISNFTNPYLELGGEASIRIPKFLFPFVGSNFARSKQTSTDFSVSYNYQTRPEYDRTILSGGIRYLWQGRYKQAARHQFDLLDINYVYLPRIDKDFEKHLPPSAVYFGYKNQFIVGMGYTYTHSTVNPAQKKRDAHSIRASVESAGNALYGISNLFNAHKDSEGSYQLFGTYYSQFIKGDIDYSKTIIIDKNNSIAWRIGGGIGIPYGNSEGLPFEKRYYSGGANSVRAWSVRELGPGSYKPNDSTTFFQQSGDIKLDFNIEYRSRFFWKLEAAAFIDAGNIWTIRDYEGQEGGKFSFNSFYKEIAIGYGLGIRLDFDFFLIRFDSGWKAYDPSKNGRDKWAILHPNFSNNWAWHIAVGYPF